MPEAHVILDADAAFYDVSSRMVWFPDPQDFRLARLANGMSSGASAVIIGFEGLDGQYICFQTSLRVMKAAVAAMEAADTKDGRPT